MTAKEIVLMISADKVVKVTEVKCSSSRRIRLLCETTLVLI